MSDRQLACPNRCRSDRFEALNAPLFVNGSGGYVGHDASRATYVCSVCAAVAIDVGAAAREMERETAATPPSLLCPGCATRMLMPEDDPLASLVECPLCGQRFSVEEGSSRLHGGAPDGGNGWGAGEGW